MAIPIDALVIDADPRVIRDFNAHYVSCRFSSEGVCSECLSTLTTSMRTKHRAYHKKEAKKEWVIADTLLAILKAGLFRFDK